MTSGTGHTDRFRQMPPGGAEIGLLTLRQACTLENPGSAMCVQNFNDSRGLAIRITYRISLRSSSLWEPRHPLLKVVVGYCQNFRMAPSCLPHRENKREPHEFHGGVGRDQSRTVLQSGDSKKTLPPQCGSKEGVVKRGSSKPNMIRTQGTPSRQCHLQSRHTMACQSASQFHVVKTDLGSGVW